LVRSLAKKPASEFLPGELLRRTPANLFNATGSRVRFNLCIRDLFFSLTPPLQEKDQRPKGSDP